MSDGFLGRWSRRKLDAKEGKPLPAEAAPDDAATPTPAMSAPAVLPAVDPAPTIDAAPQPVPLPTLEDVRALTAESDFSRFVAPDVPGAVKSAALKKLFADPRYNVMDGLDVYIDDYSLPDPLPAHVARQLAEATVVRLFDDDEEAPLAAPTRDVADPAPPGSVAQCETEPAAAPSTDAHTHLRLQQDDAAERGDAGAGAA